MDGLKSSSLLNNYSLLISENSFPEVDEVEEVPRVTLMDILTYSQVFFSLFNV